MCEGDGETERGGGGLRGKEWTERIGDGGRMKEELMDWDLGKTLDYFSIIDGM